MEKFSPKTAYLRCEIAIPGPTHQDGCAGRKNYVIGAYLAAGSNGTIRKRHIWSPQCPIILVAEVPAALPPTRIGAATLARVLPATSLRPIFTNRNRALAINIGYPAAGENGLGNDPFVYHANDVPHKHEL